MSDKICGKLACTHSVRCHTRKKTMHPLISVPFRHCIRFILFALPLLAHASLPQSTNVPGGIAVVPLCSVSACTVAPQVWFGELPVMVTADHDEWFAVVGLSLDTKPGAHELRVQIGHETSPFVFTINSKNYPEQRITLKDNSKVELSPADAARAAREISLIRDIKQYWRAASDTDTAFSLPADGMLGGRFGVRRFFNGEPRAPHSGLDVVVKRGTPIRASAQGMVLETADYFFNGKTIYVDHGNGLITMYCHLDRFDVQPGDAVSKGRQLGLSGMTGRATGPHLHWSVVLNGVMVDPEAFIAAEELRR
jgi:murein DD-endopeptidase MepM/ murein hydrolase activator NlpD